MEPPREAAVATEIQSVPLEFAAALALCLETIAEGVRSAGSSKGVVERVAEANFASLH